MGYLLAILRAIILLSSLSLYLLIFLVGSMFLKDSERFINRLKMSWCRMASKVLGLNIILEDESGIAERQENLPAFLAVCNHRTLIDPVVILTTLNLRPLSKAEVAHYPIIGYAAKKIGVIFVQRDKKQSRQNAVKAIKKGLEKGYQILVFPEGTTSGEKTTIDFRPGAFAAANEKMAPVLPLTIHYAQDYAIWLNTSLLNQYFRHFKHLKTQVYFKIGKLKYTSGSAEDVAEIRKEINHNIQVFRDLHKNTSS